MKRPPWADWPQQPPTTMLPDLERNLEPFSVAMVWLHHRVHELVHMALPFAHRTLVEGRRQRGIADSRAEEARALMQPIVSVVFSEWILVQPPEIASDAHATLQAFAQFCSDCVYDQLMATQAPAGDPRSMN